MALQEGLGSFPFNQRTCRIRPDLVDSHEVGDVDASNEGINRRLFFFNDTALVMRAGARIVPQVKFWPVVMVMRSSAAKRVQTGKTETAIWHDFPIRSRLNTREALSGDHTPGDKDFAADYTSLLMFFGSLPGIEYSVELVMRAGAHMRQSIYFAQQAAMRMYAGATKRLQTGKTETPITYDFPINSRINTRPDLVLDHKPDDVDDGKERVTFKMFWGTFPVTVGVRLLGSSAKRLSNSVATTARVVMRSGVRLLTPTNRGISVAAKMTGSARAASVAGKLHLIAVALRAGAQQRQAAILAAASAAAIRGGARVRAVGGLLISAAAVFRSGAQQRQTSVLSISPSLVVRANGSIKSASAAAMAGALTLRSSAIQRGASVATMATRVVMRASSSGAYPGLKVVFAQLVMRASSTYRQAVAMAASARVSMRAGASTRTAGAASIVSATVLRAGGALRAPTGRIRAAAARLSSGAMKRVTAWWDDASYLPDPRALWRVKAELRELELGAENRTTRVHVDDRTTSVGAESRVYRVIPESERSTEG